MYRIDSHECKHVHMILYFIIIIDCTHVTSAFSDLVIKYKSASL